MRRVTRHYEVLIVEDQLPDVILLKEAFAKLDKQINITVVSNGEEALNYLYQRGEYKDAIRPDLVLLDLNMPKVDGREVLRQVKSDDQLKNIPIIVLTNSSSASGVREVYRLHANSYVQKPLEFEDFLRTIRIITDFWLGPVVMPIRYD